MSIYVACDINIMVRECLCCEGYCVMLNAKHELFVNRRDHGMYGVSSPRRSIPEITVRG